jgi:hypothetical protein
VRALIASGQLAAHQIGGRWLVPAEAVSGFLPKCSGRPMAERSAWCTLASLAGEDVRLSARLRSRIAQLADSPSPHLRLRSWMSARGHPHIAWAFRPVIDDLLDNDRLVLSGEHGVQNLSPADHLHAYVASADVDEVMSEYGLRPPSEGKLPNIFLWAVADQSSIPRNHDNRRFAACVVAAVDLLDDGDLRAVGEARNIVAEAMNRVMVGGRG